jgi:hypothetical protein
MSNEQILALPGGRQLAYEHNGTPTSTKVVIFLHGMFSIGTADYLLPIVRDEGMHYIAPTLPGWGNSSPVPPDTTFAAYLVSAVSALLDHLHPLTDAALAPEIYIAGGAFGTVAAQILYGAPHDAFPHGRHIAGLLLIAPFAPFHCYPAYARSLSWPYWLSVGPPQRWIPRNLFHRALLGVLRAPFRDPARVEIPMRRGLFDKMGDAERAKFARWREERGYAAGQLEREFAANAVRSVASSWDGYLRVAEVHHADWGFRPGTLDEAHAKPVLVVSADRDEEAPGEHARWLVENYKVARLHTIEGGHISSLFEMNDIFIDFFKFCDAGAVQV